MTCTICGNVWEAGVPFARLCDDHGLRSGIPKAVREFVYERDEWECQLCELPVDRSVEYPDPNSPSLDHIIPFSKGGSDEPDNLRLAHLLCNVIRGNNDDETWLIDVV